GEENTPIYMTQQSGEDYTEPQGLLYGEDTLVLDHSDYSLSPILMADDEITDDEKQTYSIIDSYINPDLSKYNWMYWVLYSAYFLFILVIPYFWFFHKKVLAKFSKDGDLKEKEAIAKGKQSASNQTEEQ